MYWSDGGAVARNCTCMMRDGCFYSHYCRLPCFTPAYTKVQCKTETRDSVVCPKVCANDETKLTTRTSDSQQASIFPEEEQSHPSNQPYYPKLTARKWLATSDSPSQKKNNHTQTFTALQKKAQRKQVLQHDCLVLLHDSSQGWTFVSHSHIQSYTGKGVPSTLIYQVGIAG